MLENEQVGLAVTRNADETLVVVLDNALHCLVIAQLDPNRRFLLDQMLQVFDFLERLLMRTGTLRLAFGHDIWTLDLSGTSQ